ncbi:MAG: polysaccharide biosynthesis C-terminal domain-containing protein [Paludibacteraceae bacterium]|nr:polysaccharide biosynthesis C-terminal domain-containing protein [Paludibacteraceae bacterium]
MSEVKTLAKETAVYGLSSILGKFLNWCLVPLYTYKLATSADYGIVTNMYAWTAFCLVILTYGMETGLFRFVNDEKENPDNVYGTILTTVLGTSLLFAVGVSLMSPGIASWLGYAAHPEYIVMMAVTVSVDAVAAIPFAHLRYRKKSMAFAMLKFAFVLLNITFNLFFLVLCPYLMKVCPAAVDWFYRPDYGVGYVFLANLISTILQTSFLLPLLGLRKFRYDVALLRRVLRYSLPLLLLGVVGIINQTVDKMLMPFLYGSQELGQAQLGIYGACFKVAMVMMMFTQAFRYAYEPYVFAKNKDADSRQAYADTMKFFIITSLFIFLGMMAYLDILKYIIREDYWEGLNIVPVILVSYIFQGIYFNLSMWYKLIDRTYFGALMSLVGCIIDVGLIIVLVPRIGYMGAAVAALCAYFCIMLLSYFLGQKYMPVPYALKEILRYSLLAGVLYAVIACLKTPSVLLNYAINTLAVLAYLVYMVKTDLPLGSLPVIGKYFKK